MHIAATVVVLLIVSCSGGSNAAGDVTEVQTLAGSGEAGYVDGDLESARFTSPEGLAVGADGTVYVVETLSGRIRAIAPDGVVRTVVTSAESELRAPHRIAIGPSGAMFVTDTGNHRVVQVSATGEVIPVAGSGERGFADGAAGSARFNFPIGVAVGPDGTIFVADTGNNRVRRISPSGEVTTLAGDGTPGYRDGAGDRARFVSLNEITVGPDGTVYVSELDAHRIRAIAPDGNVSTVVGQAGAGTRDGQLERARLGGPSGLAFSGAGTLLVADTFAHRLREIVLEDQIRTVAGDGDRGFRDGDANRARFNRPTALAIGPDGSLFVADTGNHAIRRVLGSDPGRTE